MLVKNLKVQVSRSVLTAIALCVMSSSAMALDPPLFFPAGAWTVGSTELANLRGLQSMKMPCVLSNEFDNGFVVRFSGGGGQMLAMAIDFRQDAFTQGRKYDAMISIGNTYVKQASAAAFTSNTLIFNLRSLDGFYSALRGGQEMEIEIDGNVMRFSLGPIGKSYGTFENCFAGKKLPPLKPMTGSLQTADTGDVPMPPAIVPDVEAAPAPDLPQPVLPPAVASAPLPRSFDEIVENSGMPAAPPAPTPIVADIPPAPPLPHESGRVSRAIPLGAGDVPPPAAAPRPIPTAQAAWSARAGEDIRAVLSRWAASAGYDLQWQADQRGGKVVQDIALNGTFEQAVSQLLAEDGAGLGMTGYVKSPQATRGLPSNTLASGWTAPAGASIQTVLDQWATRAGVTVTWDSFMNVPLKAPVSSSGSFESAVEAVLDQYRDDPARPVGALNTDPQTGQRTLVMTMDRTG